MGSEGMWDRMTRLGRDSRDGQHIMNVIEATDLYTHNKYTY